MSGCTETGKPRIAILMAVYEPRMDWLREQLLSLNAQTYPNLRLYVRDDGSAESVFAEITACLQNCITAFPYEIARNEKNLGSNKTFERLTRDAQGDFFAYCDQDDVWLPQKLEILEGRIGSAAMAYCDMSVIDGDGKPVALSLRDIRPRLRYLSGENLAESFFFRNCTAGCSMLVRSAYAKKALPFPDKTVCDQWIATIAALSGEIRLVDESLQKYRQHKDNQTSILHGVTGKKSYREKRIFPLQERLAAYRNIASPSRELEAFVHARETGSVRGLFRYRAFSPYESAFEILMHFLPDWAVRSYLRRLT